MYNFFYSFHNKPLGYELFNRDAEDGTPSPPSSQFLLNNDEEILLNNNNEPLIK